MNVLTTIQREIEELYLLPSFERIDNFLINETTLRAYGKRDVEETLLVEERESTLLIGLYIAPHVLSLLEADPPWQRLDRKNLEAFCTAVEGVSHFLFLIARYTADRPVSQLELELQAEVDKFLLCSLLLERQEERDSRRRLAVTLFDRYRLLPGLDQETAHRYHLANRLAFQFCRTLQRFAHPIDRPRFIRTARRFRNR